MFMPVTMTNTRRMLMAMWMVRMVTPTHNFLRRWSRIAVGHVRTGMLLGRVPH